MTLPMLLLPSAFIGALCLVLTPRLAENSALGRGDQIGRHIYKSLLTASVLILPSMALLVVFGPLVARLLFQEPAAGSFLLPLSVGVVFSCYQTVLGACLNGLGGRTRPPVISRVRGGAAVFTYCTVGLPNGG
jgi:stage V sporulation protein B